MKKKIIIIAHPSFVEGLQELLCDQISYEMDVISFKDPLFLGKTGFQKISLLRKYDIVHVFWGHVRIFDLILFRIFAKVRIVNNFIGTDLHNIISKNKVRKTVILSPLLNSVLN